MLGEITFGPLGMQENLLLFLLSSSAEEWLTYTPLIEKSSQYQGFSLMDNAPN